MFSIILIYRYKRIKKKIEEKGNKLRYKSKLIKFKLYFLISILVDLLILSTIIFISNFMGMVFTISTLSNMWDRVDIDNSNEIESGWHWSIGDEGNDIQTSSGLYPKNRELRQLAMFIEASEKSAQEANRILGVELVNPSIMLTVTLRETGGVLINKLVEDTSLNIYKDLIYEIPTCGKGSGCRYIRNGISHFIGGTVINGVDSGDPAINPVNNSPEDYRRAGGDHAMGYFQFENISIDGMLVRPFPIGEYADKEYVNDDRYKMDGKLGFIRPNIAYIPDNLINVALHNGDIGRYGSGLSKAWNEIQSTSWYKGLSAQDQQFVWSALKELSYQSGSFISYEATKPMIATLELVAVMKYDGYIDTLYDIVPFFESYYGGASGITNRIYNKDTHRISRPGDTVWTRSFNKLLNDNTLKSDTRAAANKVKGTLSAGRFRTYAEAGNRALYADIPPKSIASVSMGNYIYNEMQKQIAEAEKEESGGIVVGGSVPGVSPSNFFETPGVGQGIWNGKTSEELVGNSRYYRETKHMWGTSVTLSSGNDPFNSLNSTFSVPYYSQSSRVGNETWSRYNTGRFNLQNSGCGIYMWAHIASALQQRLINPPEMLAVGTHFGAFQSGTGLFTWDRDSHNRLANSFGYKVTMYTRREAREDYVWNDLNQALNKNIPSGFRSSNTFTTGGSHFLNIDSVTDDGRYILAQTNIVAAEKRTWSRAELFNTFHRANTCLYVIDNR